MKPSLLLADGEAVAGLPFARSAPGTVVDESRFIERRLEQANERAAWDTLRKLGAALAA